MAMKILIMKIYSRFKGTDLSHSMLANFVMPQHRDRGAMAAMGRGRPPWLGCISKLSYGSYVERFKVNNKVERIQSLALREFIVC